MNLNSCPQGGVGAMLPIESKCKQSEKVDHKAQKIKKELNDLVDYLQRKKHSWRVFQMDKKFKIEYKELTGEEKLQRIHDRNDEIKVLLDNIIMLYEQKRSPAAVKIFNNLLICSYVKNLDNFLRRKIKISKYLICFLSLDDSS